MIGRALKWHQSLNVAQIVQSAMQHHQAGRLKRATALYRQALAIDPAEPNALHLLGVVAHQRGDNQQAITLITQSVHLVDNNADAFNNLGEAYRTVSQFSEATSAYRNALAIDPLHVGAHNNLGLALTALGDTEAAIGHFERALQLAPDDPDIHLALGVVYAEQNDRDDALACWRKALRLGSSPSHLIGEVFDQMLGHGYLDAAMDLHRTLHRKHPYHNQALMRLADTLKLRRRTFEAIDYYEKALAENPNQPAGWLDLSACLIDVARVDQASAALETACEHGADEVYALILRSEILLRQFQWEAAERAVRDALALDQSDTRAQIQLASVLFHRGDIESAAGWYFSPRERHPHTRGGYV